MNQSTLYRSVFNSDSSETVAYNNPLFPAYVVRGTLSLYPDYSFISHWHKDLEFILIKKGSMTYNVNGRLIGLHEEDGIMVNSRQLHYGFSAEHHECDFICILISPELLQANDWFYQNFVEPVIENPAYPYLHLTRSGWMTDILDKLEEMYRFFHQIPAGPGSYFKLVEDFYKIMELLYENLKVTAPAAGAEASDLICLKSMISCIEEHYMERLALSDIALSGACCKSKCSLLFQKYLRDTPITYVTKFRLRKSLSLLLNSSLSIADIAYECGFSGASYYCETFKKYYGMPPLVYKKRRN